MKSGPKNPQEHIK